jgi:hypothetical protein
VVSTRSPGTPAKLFPVAWLRITVAFVVMLNGVKSGFGKSVTMMPPAVRENSGEVLSSAVFRSSQRAGPWRRFIRKN